MKKSKIQLTELRVKSFVTRESRAILAGKAEASDDTWDLWGCQTTELAGSVCGPGMASKNLC